MSEARPFRGEIYVHTCTANDKSYVGQTTASMAKRWNLHLRCARSPKTPAYRNLFSKAIRKYGAEAFESQVMSVAGSQAELDNLEKIWILLVQTKAPKGYNLTDGGDRGTAGHAVSPEVRARLSLAAKEQWKNPEFRQRYSELRRGQKMAPAAQENRLAALRAAIVGKKQSPETIAKRVAKLKGKKRTQVFRDACAVRMQGRKLSAETRQRMSKAQRLRQERSPIHGTQGQPERSRVGD